MFIPKPTINYAFVKCKQNNFFGSYAINFYVKKTMVSLSPYKQRLNFMEGQN